MNRRHFLKSSALGAGAVTVLPFGDFTRTSSQDDFPLTDLHVHTTQGFTLDHIMKIAEERKVKFGIVEHPAPWAIKNDKDLEKYIDHLRQYPVYVGLQPISPGWSKYFSAELLDRVDYILMDPQRVPMKNGEILKIWNFDTYVENTEEFMKRYMDYSLKILEEEPIDVFGWPLFLPVCIARDYYELWTEERMQQILTAAKKRNIAIEINDMSHTPHAAFILKAKQAGLKFTFGSDARNPNAGRLAYCKRVARECGLAEEDFFVPEKKG